MNTIDILSKLISFRTISELTNKELAKYISNYLAKYKVKTQLFEGNPGQFNLYAKIGPEVDGGIILSGHTDVVPTEGQNWITNPFKLVKKKNKLFGRGSCDMKGFIAVVLALIPKLKINKLKKPLHLIFSYDEEIGCVGIQKLIPFLKKIKPKPAFCIVGEPTEMKVVIAHKGKTSFQCHVRGSEAHSSLAPEAVNAVEFAAELISHIKATARKIKKNGPFDPLFDVPHTTIHTGNIKGGTALNIVPKECCFEFEIRHLPEESVDTYMSEIKNFIREELEPEMKSISADSGFVINIKSAMPGLHTLPEDSVVTFAKSLTKQNTHSKVSFGTEAGPFQKTAGIPTVVCGPGSIVQAHKPDEFIAVEQVAKCSNFLDRLAERACVESL